MPVPEKREVRAGVIVALLLFVPYLVASMLAPETVPRLGLLPAPSNEVRYVESTRKGCPPYSIHTSWQHGIFWEKGPTWSFGDECIPANR